MAFRTRISLKMGFHILTSEILILRPSNLMPYPREPLIQCTTSESVSHNRSKSHEKKKLYNSPQRNAPLSLPCELSNRPTPCACAVTMYKTCTAQQWNGFRNSVRNLDQRSACWQHTNHFDLRQDHATNFHHNCFPLIMYVQRLFENTLFQFQCKSLQRFFNPFHL